MKVLVVGKAKTGTTIVSKSIETSLNGKAEYYLEPKFFSFFEGEEWSQKQAHQVVKIIFDHFKLRKHMLNAILHNEGDLKFDKLIFIVRDPRDELISRTMYIIYPEKFSPAGVSQVQFDEWLERIREKEKNPQDIPFAVLFDDLNRILNGRFKMTGEDMFKKVLRESLYYFKFVKLFKSTHYILRYEDFISQQFQGLCNYMDLNIIEQNNLGDLERTLRSKTSNNWKRLAARTY